MENKEPREYDAVLGGQVSPPSDGAVLGGLEGAKQRFIDGDDNYRILALSQLINYGQEGLDLVIKALKDSSEKVQLQAYKLLRDIPEAKVRQAIQEFNPYRFFECVHTTYSGYTQLPVAIAFKPSEKTLLFCYNHHNGYSEEEFNINIREYIDGFEEESYSVFNTNGIKIDIIEIDLETGKHIKIIGGKFGKNIYSQGFSVRSLALSSDAQTLAIGGFDYKTSTGRIELWNLKTKEIINILNGQSQICINTYDIAYNSEQKILVSGSEIGEIIVWDLETQKPNYILGKHSSKITSFNISEDGRFLFASSLDKTVKVWDLITKENIHTFKHCNNTLVRAINPNVKMLYYNDSNNSINIWESKTSNNIRNFSKLLGGDIEFLTTTLDGKTVVSCGGKYLNERHLMVWNFETGKHLMTLPQRAYSAGISPDGQTIASFSDCGVIKVWRVP